MMRLQPSLLGCGAVKARGQRCMLCASTASLTEIIKLEPEGLASMSSSIWKLFYSFSKPLTTAVPGIKGMNYELTMYRAVSLNQV